MLDTDERRHALRIFHTGSGTVRHGIARCVPAPFGAAFKLEFFTCIMRSVGLRRRAPTRRIVPRRMWKSL